MQGRNSTQTNQPKSGDGTQDVRRKQDANWFGQSQEPQEEFAYDHDGQGGRNGPVNAVEPDGAKVTAGPKKDEKPGTPRH